MKFFGKHPKIQYGGVSSINLLARSVISPDVFAQARAFYSYDVEEGQRADIIADAYYDNSDYAWLVYMSNSIVDPYYDFPITTEQFDLTMKSKYGSIEQARRLTHQYVINWDGDDTILTPLQFIGLVSEQQKYYTSVIDSDGNVIEYRRARLTDAVNTNQIIRVDLADVTGFVLGLVYNQSNQIIGEIQYIGEDHILLQHIQNSFEVGEQIVQGSVTETIVAIETLASTSASADNSFWKRQSKYDYEYSQLLENRSIQLLSGEFKTQASQQLFKLMNGRL